MRIVEMILAFRLAEEQGYVNDTTNYASCNGDCTTCPANSTCDYLSGPTADNSTFKSNFSSLIHPYLQEYTMNYIKLHYPELFI